MISINSKALRILYSLLVSIIVFDGVWGNTRKVTSLLHIQSGTVLSMATLCLTVTLFTLLFTALAVKPKETLSFLGLNGNVLKGFGVALLCVAPIYIGFLFFGAFNSDTSFAFLLRMSVFSGFIEELVFRAFMFGMLFRYAKTGFFWAVMLPALYFGVSHLYQGHDMLSSLAAFGVTFIGAVYFSWMYVEWNFNIWVPVCLHALMNGAWGLFTMEGTEVAAGGLISNILRVASILLAIGITIWYKRRTGTKVFSYPVWKF